MQTMQSMESLAEFNATIAAFYAAIRRTIRMTDVHAIVATEDSENTTGHTGTNREAEGADKEARKEDK